MSASSDARVSLTGLTFQGCKSSSGWGGAIFAHNAKLVLKNVRFYDNAAIRGGAFALNGSQADCIRCKFDGNIALTHGNDIFVARDGILQTDECLFKAPGRSGQRNTPYVQTHYFQPSFTHTEFDLILVHFSFFGGHIAIGDSQSGGGLAIRRSCFLDAYSPDTGIGGSIAILFVELNHFYLVSICWCLIIGHTLARQNSIVQDELYSRFNICERMVRDRRSYLRSSLQRPRIASAGIDLYDEQSLLYEWSRPWWCNFHQRWNLKDFEWYCS